MNVALAVIKTVTSEPVAILTIGSTFLRTGTLTAYFSDRDHFLGEIWRDLLIFGQNPIEICQIGGKISYKKVNFASNFDEISHKKIIL